MSLIFKDQFESYEICHSTNQQNCCNTLTFLCAVGVIVISSSTADQKQCFSGMKFLSFNLAQIVYV